MTMPDLTPFHQTQNSALNTLRVLLNDRYCTDLAVMDTAPAYDSTFLRVQRGTSYSDVVVAVAVVPDDTHGHIYLIEAYTWIAWDSYQDAFVSLRVPFLADAVYAVTAYVPAIPTH